jgi:hypothetical protein
VIGGNEVVNPMPDWSPITSRRMPAMQNGRGQPRERENDWTYASANSKSSRCR